MFTRYATEVEMIVDEIIQLCYFMRGAISYESMMLRTPGERQRIGNFIEKRLDAESKSMSPNY